MESPTQKRATPQSPSGAWATRGTKGVLGPPLQKGGAGKGCGHSLSTGPAPLPQQLAMGKMMEQGPVLIITFQAQLVMVIKNPKGEVVEGDPVSEGGIGAGRVGGRPQLPVLWSQEVL